MATRESQTVAKEDLLYLFALANYLPRETVLEVLSVFHHGELKYGRDNWRTPPYLSKQEILRSTMRHLQSIYNGAIKNPDGDVYHAGNLIVNGLFLLTGEIEGWWEEKKEEEQEATLSATVAPSTDIQKLFEKLKHEWKQRLLQQVEVPPASQVKQGEDPPSKPAIDLSDFFVEDDEEEEEFTD